MTRVFKDKQGNKLFVYGNGAFGKTKDNKAIPKGKAKQLLKEHQKEQRKRLDFGKPIDLGKEIHLGKRVELGKEICLGREVDFGKEIDLGKEFNFRI